LTIDNLFWLLLFLVLPFALVIARGAPYLPTRKDKLDELLDKLNVAENQLMLDLGSGDGSVLAYVAKHYQMRGLGYELNPFLVLISRLRLLKYRKLVKIKYADFWSKDIPNDVEYIFIFLMPKFIARLNSYLENEISKPIILISYAFEVPKMKPFEKAGGFRAYKIKPNKK